MYRVDSSHPVQVLTDTSCFMFGEKDHRVVVDSMGNTMLDISFRVRVVDSVNPMVGPYDCFVQRSHFTHPQLGGVISGDDENRRVPDLKV